MKTLLNYFSLLAIITFTCVSFASCSNSSDELEDITQSGDAKYLSGKWELVSKTFEGDNSFENLYVTPAWFSIEKNNSAKYDYNGKTIDGMYSYDYSPTLATLAFFPKSLAEGDITEGASSCVFMVESIKKDTIVLTLELEVISCKLTAIYKKM